MSQDISIEALELFGRAAGILKARGLADKDLTYKQTGEILTAPVRIRVEHGSAPFELKVGKFSADELQVVTDINWFCTALKEVLEVTKYFRASMRFAIFRGPGLRSTQFLEIVVLTGGEQEAILSLKLEDHHFDIDYLNARYATA